MLPEKQNKRKAIMRQIILDTETTGLNPNDPNHPDRIIEFAGLEMINRQFTNNNLHLYIHPQRDIPEDSVAIHGITLEKLADKPKFEEVAQEIINYLKGAELIIHNAQFDISFLNAELARIGQPEIENIVSGVVDTLQMARERYPGQRNSLDSLCTRLDIDRSKRVLHGALIDCELLGEVYLAMTRQQGSLLDSVLSDDKKTRKTQNAPKISVGKLTILRANPEEEAAHLAYLKELDKAAKKGYSLYRQDEQNPEHPE